MNDYNVAYGYWEQSICRANRCFDQSHTLLALFYYQQAIQRSDVLLEANPASRQSIGAMLVSHHNLAELYQRNGAFRAAWQHFQATRLKTHDILQCSGELPGPLWGSRIAYTQLCLFEKQHGAYGATKSGFLNRNIPLVFQSSQQSSTH